MNTACKTMTVCAGFRLQLAAVLLVLLLGGCVPYTDPPVRVEPKSRHDLEADRTFCAEYAAQYGVINLGPILGEKAQNQPDRRRRSRLFILCMEEKGYRF